MQIEEAKYFWTKEIRPRFSKSALEAKVRGISKFYVRYVNLDNAATTKPFRSVVDKVKEFLDEYGSVHRGAGQHSIITTERYESARDRIRRFVGASDNNYILFTKNTTEAVNNLSTLLKYELGKVLVSEIEHSSNLLPWLKNGEIKQYKTNEKNEIDLDDLEAKLKNNEIKLVVVTGASNVTGYKPPVYEIAKLAHKYGTRIFVDCCQLLQHEKVDVLEDDDLRHLDFIAFSGHKMYAPFGSGCLVGPKDFFDESSPYQIGGGNLPYITHNLEIKRFKNVRAHDPGSPNAVGAIAIEEAINNLEDIGLNKIAEYENTLMKVAIEKIKQIRGVNLYIDQENIPGTVIPFDMEGINHKIVAEKLAEYHGIGLRSGSFCCYELVRRLKNISREQDQKIADEVESGITTNIPGIVRASIALCNNLEDIDTFVEGLSYLVTYKG
ncbi:aminotransferase class V-fold PLP-dependent enzyme [Candidatus Woesearchaeota archaeon]|nr:aminotransferase class V-fold PLP-dependent enzyme [Candidatus Woesearchaeota archaeon]